MYIGNFSKDRILFFLTILNRDFLPNYYNYTNEVYYFLMEDR